MPAVPRLWPLLALLAVPTARAGPGRCPREHLGQVWGVGTKCCPRCTWAAGEPCARAKEEKDDGCKCARGFSCADDTCQFCREIPGCEPGWEPHRIGEVNFQFECKPCENGSYSSSRDGWCLNWTDCESSGFLTLRAGNSTHNSVCSLASWGLEPAGIPLGFSSSTILALLVAVAVFVLILLTLLLHFCLWSLHRQKKIPPGDLGHHIPRGEESPSIQFPEEEHGDKTSQEKLSSLSLKIYSELG